MADMLERRDRAIQAMIETVKDRWPAFEHWWAAECGRTLGLEIGDIPPEPFDAALDAAISALGGADPGAAMQALIGTGLSWSHQYFPCLEEDREAQFTPEDHFCVRIILSYEDEAEGWGDTFAGAAQAALAKMRAFYTPANSLT